MQYKSADYDPTQFSSIEPGDYHFLVTSAKDKQSKAGNDMITLEMEVFVPNRKAVKVFDYLVAMDSTLHKIKGFCEAVGLEFTADNLDCADCYHARGRAKFILGMPKENGNRYLEVKEYYPADKTANAPSNSEPAPVDTTDQGDDSDIPF